MSSEKSPEHQSQTGSDNSISQSINETFEESEEFKDNVVEESKVITLLPDKGLLLFEPVCYAREQEEKIDRIERDIVRYRKYSDEPEEETKSLRKMNSEKSPEHQSQTGSDNLISQSVNEPFEKSEEFKDNVNHIFVEKTIRLSPVDGFLPFEPVRYSSEQEEKIDRIERDIVRYRKYSDEPEEETKSLRKMSSEKSPEHQSQTGLDNSISQSVNEPFEESEEFKDNAKYKLIVEEAITMLPGEFLDFEPVSYGMEQEERIDRIERDIVRYRKYSDEPIEERIDRVEEDIVGIRRYSDEPEYIQETMANEKAPLNQTADAVENDGEEESKENNEKHFDDFDSWWNDNCRLEKDFQAVTFDMKEIKRIDHIEEDIVRNEKTPLIQRVQYRRYSDEPEHLQTMDNEKTSLNETADNVEVDGEKLKRKKKVVFEETIVPLTQIDTTKKPPPKKQDKMQSSLLSFGKIYFQNNSSTNIALARFAVFPQDFDMNEIYQVLTKAWLQHPVLLISIIGGKNDKQLDEKLVDQLKSGFEKVLDTKAAWVITDGTKKGMLKDIISDITESDENTVIGIRSWNEIKNRKSLEERINSDKNDYFYKSSNAKSNGSKQYLDSNHSHFLFVHNNTDEGVEEDISSIFRSCLENFIIEKEDGPSSVILLIGGGKNELLYVYNKLPKMPVVLVKGTGGITDILCYVIENMEEVFQEKDVLTLPDTLSEQLNEIGDNESGMMISECISHKELFSIFDVDKEDEEDSNSFDDVLLRSLILKSNTETYDKVQQCIFWNRTAIMKDIDISQLTGDMLNNVVIMAVALNQVKFVEALFDQGDFDETVFDKVCIAFLYGFRSKNENSILKYTKDPWRYLKNKEIGETKEIYKYLCRLRKYEEDIFIRYENVLSLFETFSKVFHANTCVKDHFAQQISWNVQSTEKGNIKGNQNIYQVLLIWAVINNMHTMALFFWKLCDNRLPCAIVAAEINKAIGVESKKLRLNIGFCNKYFDNAEKWKETAVKMVKQLYIVGFDETQHILTKPFCNCLKENLYSIQTQSSMELAYISNFEELIAHNAVQQILSDMWTNQFDLPKYSALKVFATVLFPPLVVFTHNKRDRKYSIKDSKRANDQQVLIHKTIQEKIEQEDSEKQLSTEVKSPVTKLQEKMVLYSKTPLVKFYSNTVTFIIFLFVLARECISKRTENYITPWEYVLLLFVVSYSTEEIHQVFVLYRQSYQKKVFQSIKLHFKSFWNILDVVAIVLFYIALGLRIYKETNRYGILLYGIDAWFWILRVLYLFYADRILGPYVIVIGRMCTDIVQFVTILLVFIVAYGVTSTTIIRPKETSYLWLRDVFFQPYFNIYGELFIEGDKEKGKTRFGGDEVDGYSETIALFFLGFYLLIANVLLLNLLIAIFGNTFGKVQEKSDRIWKYNRYAFVYGYIHTPRLVQPFTFIGHIYDVLKWVYRKCYRKINNRYPNRTMEKPKVGYNKALLYRKLQTKIVCRILNEMNDSEESTNDS